MRERQSPPTNAVAWHGRETAPQRRRCAALLLPLAAVLLPIAAVLLPIATARADEPKRLLLVGQGPDGHPPETHEFMAGLRVLSACLKPIDGLVIETVKADEPWADGPEKIASADGVVLFLSQGSRWMQNDPRRYDALSRLAARGGGMVALHWAIGAHDAKYIEGQLKLLGGSRGGPQRKYQVLETTLEPADREHPVVRGFEPLRVHDEFYYRLDIHRAEPPVRPLLVAEIDGNKETVAWTWQRPDGGRSFGFVGLHFHRNWQVESYRRLVVQGVLWSMKLDVPEKGVDVSVEADVLKLERK